MTNYNFKKHVKLYIVLNGLQYRIDVGEISFNQTFAENSYEVKTLHEPQNMFEGSTIVKANAANFSFKLPLIKQADHQILFDLMLSYDSNVQYGKNIQSFDLYVQTQESIFKIETCVIASSTFIIERKEILGLELTGEASKLTRAGDFGNYVIPGTPQTYTSTPSYIIPTDLTLVLDSVDISSSVHNISIELQNQIQWLKHTTVNEGINVTDTSNTMYPTEFVLEKRILAGSISRYLRRDNVSSLQEWVRNVPLHIFAGDGAQGLDINTSAITLTNRLNTGSIFQMNYDWRMVENPSDLNSVITYSTL